MRYKTLAGGASLLFLLLFTLQIQRVAVQASQAAQATAEAAPHHIYFAESNGEAGRYDRSADGLSRFAGLLQRLGTELYTINWQQDIPDDADLVVIAGPTTDFPPDQVARLWSYVSRGGHLLLLTDPLVQSLQRGVVVTSVNKAFPSVTGLFDLTWTDLGIRALDDIVLDRASLQATADSGALPVRDFVVNNPAENPITAGVTQLAFFGARSLDVDSSIQQFDAESLASSGGDLYGEIGYADYLKSGTLEYNIGTDVTSGQLTLAASVQNQQTGTRVVLIGDRDFATNGYGLQTSPPSSAGFVYPGNVHFLLNSVLWLLGESPTQADSLTFATPGPTATITVTPSPTPSPTPTAAVEATPTGGSSS